CQPRDAGNAVPGDKIDAFAPHAAHDIYELFRSEYKPVVEPQEAQLSPRENGQFAWQSIRDAEQMLSQNPQYLEACARLGITFQGGEFKVPTGVVRFPMGNSVFQTRYSTSKREEDLAID